AGSGEPRVPFRLRPDRRVELGEILRLADSPPGRLRRRLYAVHPVSQDRSAGTRGRAVLVPELASSVRAVVVRRLRLFRGGVSGAPPRQAPGVRARLRIDVDR